MNLKFTEMIFCMNKINIFKKNEDTEGQYM